jgi:WD40 repeat protein
VYREARRRWICSALRPRARNRFIRILSLALAGRQDAHRPEQHTCRFWDVATGKELHARPGHTAEVYTLAFSADGKTLATRGADCSIRVWDVATCKQIRQLSGGERWMPEFILSPDGKMVASFGEDDYVRLWDLASGEMRHQFKQPPVRTLRDTRSVTMGFSLDSQTLGMTRRNTGTLSLCATATGKERCVLEAENRFVFSTDSKALLTYVRTDS